MVRVRTCNSGDGWHKMNEYGKCVYFTLIHGTQKIWQIVFDSKRTTLTVYMPVLFSFRPLIANRIENGGFCILMLRSNRVFY